MRFSTTENANYYHLVMDIAWFGLGLAATSRFMQFYAIRLGASPIELGLIASLPSLVLVFATYFGLWWRGRFQTSLDAVWWPSIGFRMVFLLPIFAPFFPENLRIFWLVLAVSLPALAQGIASSIFLVMVRETITQERLAKLYARRQVAVNVAIMVSAMGFGLILEIFSFPGNYQLMFLLAFAFAMMSQWHLGRLHVLHEPDHDHEPLPHPHIESPLRVVRTALSNVRFQAVAWITVVSHVAFFSIFSVVPLHLERDLGATESFMAAFSVAELISGAFSAMLVGRIISKVGARVVVAVAMAITALAALAIAIAPTLPLTLVGAALTGAGWSAASLGVLSFLTERTDADDLHAPIVWHQILFLATFIGPLLGSGLVQAGAPIVVVILGGAGLRLVSAYLSHRGLSIFPGRQRVEPVRELRTQ